MTVPVSTSYALLAGLAFCNILQPRGSLLFPWSHWYFWRLSPILALIESILIVIWLVVLRYNPRAIMRARVSSFHAPPSEGTNRTYQIISALPVLFMVVKAVGTRGSPITVVLGATYGFSWAVVQVLSYLCDITQPPHNDDDESETEYQQAHTIRARSQLGSTTFGEWAQPVDDGLVFYAALMYAFIIAGVCALLSYLRPWRAQVVGTLSLSLFSTACVLFAVVGVTIGWKKGGGMKGLGRILRFGTAKLLGNADFWGTGMFLVGSVVFITCYEESGTSKAVWTDWLPG